MKTFTITALFFLTSFVSFSQQQVEIEWLNRFGSSDFDITKKITTTSNGDVISFGYFTDTVDFDPSSSVNELTSYEGDDWSDLFVQKTTESGTVLWTKQFKGKRREYARGLIVDEFDNIYLTLTHSDSMDADPGPAVELITSDVNYGMALVKLDPNGDFVWVKTFDSEFGVWAEEVIIDNNGDLLLAGRFSGELDFDPSNSQYVVDITGSSNIFILKLDINGDFIWVKTFSSNAGDKANDITVDSMNNIYITGIVDMYYSASTTSSIEFAPGMSIAFNHEKKGFILKMDDSGTPLWLIENGTEGHKIRLGNDGNLTILGEYIGDVDFDPSSASLELSSETPATFVQKVTPNGDLVWAKSYPVRSESIALDQNDNIYFTGNYEGTAEFSDPSLNMTAHGFADICVLRLASNGDVMWTRSMGSIHEDRGYDLTLSNDGKLYVAGYYSLLCSFGPGAGTFYAEGMEDAFLLKLSTFVSLEEETMAEVGVYPNPSNGVFQITQAEAKDWDLAVQDVNGKVLLRKEFGGTSLSVDLSGFADGVYFLSGIGDEGRFVERVVKE